MYVVLLAFTLFGCGQDPLKDDLTNYFQAISEFEEIETNALTDVKSVIGSRDNEARTKAIESSTSKYGLFVQKLNDYSPKTDEIKEIHGQYIAAAMHQYNALLMAYDASLSNNIRKIAEANEKILQSRDEYEQFQKQLLELADKHGL